MNLETQSREKILLIRFSSFGDVTQCLSVPSVLKKKFPAAEIHWVTREDMAPLLLGHPQIHRVWSFPRKGGLSGLFRLSRELRRQHFTRIYDAHNNLRSHVISWSLRFPFFGLRPPKLLRRSIRRLRRLMLFRFRVNLFEMPFSGQRDLIEPLKKWSIPVEMPNPPQIFLQEDDFRSLPKTVPSSFIAVAPSAAFELKRWPLEYWKKLVQLLPNENFVILGGPEDHFLQALVDEAPSRVFNLAGTTSFRQSAAVIKNSKALVSNDTGLLHVGEQLGHPTVALMGPAPFGFPSRSSTKILELSLPCRPCSKHGQGPCVNPQFHQCLRGIDPQQVADILRKF